VFALFVWWFSTGFILFLDTLPKRTFGWSMLAASACLVLSLRLVFLGIDDTTEHGAYVAFACGVAVWGWQEMSFLMGFITGPRRTACPEGASGLRHFWYATQAVIWHELAIAAGCAVLAWISEGGANRLALWTYCLLWGLRLSAKLNLFLGVRNLNAGLLPDHLTYLASYFRERAMNMLFPLSITVSIVLTLVLFQRAVAAEQSVFLATCFTFLGTMMALGLVEHWFMIVPLPFADLWAWYTRGRERTPTRHLASIDVPMDAACTPPSHQPSHQRYPSVDQNKRLPRYSQAAP
jgi:putative photosynthetic complex assembly protein 2